MLGLLYAVTVVAWSATALMFGRLAALLSPALLLVYPAWATLYHQASSDAVFATGLALWALLVARTLRTPCGRAVRRGRRRPRRPRAHPAREPDPAPGRPPAAARARRLAPRLVWSGACLAAAVGLLGAWAVHNGVRYDDATVARGGRAWVPFLRVFLADKTISPENGPDSRGSGQLIEREVLASEPFRGARRPARRVPPERLELRDRPADRDLRPRTRAATRTTTLLFGSALEAIREHPGTYVDGVADAYWKFLTQVPLREDVVRREQTAPEQPPPTFEADGVVFPNPQANVLVEGVPYGFVWCASDYIDSCVIRPAGAGLGRRASGRSGTARSSRRCASGTRTCRRGTASTSSPRS